MTSSRQPIVLLGSTGSIGTQALDIVRANPLRFDIRGLAAGGGNIERLARQVVEFDVPVVSVDRRVGGELRDAIHTIDSSAHPQIIEGPDGATQVASLVPDGVVLNGITGGVGLLPTLAALKSGATLALANKESLVVGGHVVRSACVRPGQIVPVDSEHSAIAQALASGVHEAGLTSPVVTGHTEVADLVLTASGGPFRGKKRAELADITPEAALAHPTWNMGPVVTINSSTLVNKGLELIEAHLLFDVAPEHIVTTVHPQSIVHSMVTWIDGATTLQASPPDMRLPIALGLTWPERLHDVEKPLTWADAQSWTFEPVDSDTFPAINLARHAVASSPTHAAVYNAANEVFVDAFLAKKLPWLGIVDSLTKVVESHDGIADPTLDDILGVEEWARAQANALVSRSS
ncbi:1-deoxy-D-xylulose-5-phosphate reductoisomerase [Pauljensenia sp. UMB6358]|uniref:1-deoxy-D-xylulose-5-phosphate reductoisomerase n=1 Tax=Actinomycetaceae TaxID=2049 RepID=UPI001C5E0926|nr:MULTISPECIES: 1-deoxy-D-xylulose-5-phosphate reductoisomerase [Actinomycetaceae]MDK7121552.1 1-deoxy-D-xylulose-5-phosphate reductoisomerase [Pauljensenia sp. UMB6358]MDK7230976.1 1-deoxy-D-xylulose-5-phosphate reductoisomerase [Pauljensenia sp. UMB1177]MDK7338259.1 1-deoxy-D-xylulose-5-phosphate reductoisomerase [Pauljensenia sp. UMB0895]QYB16175.1 1-deoxy-D-xylulose-5-phosphate reductoisomerase [Schaalia turicensis]